MAQMWLQDDSGQLIATVVNGEIFFYGKERDSREKLAYELFRMMFNLMQRVPSSAVGDNGIIPEADLDLGGV